MTPKSVETNHQLHLLPTVSNSPNLTRWQIVITLGTIL